MNKVILKKIELANFKGFAKADRFFDVNRENISAENGQGKTTLRDAWFWVLGFNVSDVIPCRDNKEIPNLEIVVSCEVSISNGVSESTYILTRVQKEVRKTNKDTGVEEKVSNESTYSIDGTPFILRNYKEKLAELFGVPYDKLQMLCQQEYFNGETLKWGWYNRRKELFDLCEVDELLADMVSKECYSLIAPDIRKKYSTTEIKKAVRKELAGYSSDKEKNTILIADKQNEMSKYNGYDFTTLETEKATLESQITDIMVSGTKKAVNEEIVSLQQEKSDITAKIYRIKAEDAHEIGELQQKSTFIKGELDKTQSRAEALKREMSDAQSIIERLEAEINDLSGKVWEGETVCPTCKQSLPADTIEASKKRFEDEKAKRLEVCSKNIDERLEFLKGAKVQLTQYRETYTNLRSQKQAYDAELEKINTESKIAPYNARIAEIDDRIREINAQEKAESDVSQYVEPLKRRVSEINSILGYKRLVSDFATRVEQLKELNRELTDKEMVAKEKVRQIDKYVAEQVKLVFDVINSKFHNGISFSLFTELYAGSEHEIKEECVCVLNGKTYNEMSYGERFFADLEVTRVLQEQYGVSLPIFLDNAECYTGDIANGSQQLILLYAKKGEYLTGVKIEVIL